MPDLSDRPAPAATRAPVDVTAVRARLYAQGGEYLDRRHHYFAVMNQEAELGEPGLVASWAYEALVSAGTFQWTLSAVLLLLQQAPELAVEAALIVAAVQDAGIEAIEFANGDLPEPVPAAVSARDAVPALIPAQGGAAVVPDRQRVGRATSRRAAGPDPAPRETVGAVDADPVARRALTELAAVDADGAL